MGRPAEDDGAERFGRQASPRAVERAIAELRRGDAVLVVPDAAPPLVVRSAEQLGAADLARLRRLAGAPPSVILTRRRAAALGLAQPGEGVVAIAAGALDPETVAALADPTRPVPGAAVAGLSSDLECLDGAEAAVRLAKLARLLPAVVAAPLLGALPEDADLLSVAARDVVLFETRSAELRRVGEAAVPLAGAEATRIVAFRAADGGPEHLAIVVGTPDPSEPVLVRLHSECFTGDLLGSLRCDCGEQLRGAITTIAAAGGGALLYLAQEGRGIGLVNKLRAYQLQDGWHDTVEANLALGFDADERRYAPAAEMLHQLGYRRIRLLTNNPDKVDQLARCGIEVVERRPLAYPANDHNAGYLRAKRQRSGHYL